MNKNMTQCPLDRHRGSRSRLTLLSFLVMVATAVHSEEEDLYEMALEDLLNISVTVASKTKETLADSPSSVSVYNQDLIDDLGYFTLEKLADITPGYSTRTTLGNTVFETRGAFGDLNAKHLLLIDGIPVNFAREYMAMAQEQLPLHFARQVEFLRGPASALYGVSAFNGVISITSRSQEDEGSTFNGHLAGGTFDSERRQMFTSLHKNDSNTVHFSYGHYEKEDSLARIPGYDPLQIDDDGNGSIDRVYNVKNQLRDGQSSDFMYLKYSPSYFNLEGLSLGIINMRKQSHYWESWNRGQDTSEINREIRDTWVYYAKYETGLTDDVSLNSYLKYSNSKERGVQHNKIWVDNPGIDEWFFHFDVDSSSYEGLAEINWQINDESNLIAGINYDERDQNEPGAFLFDANNNSVDIPFFTRHARTRSFYTQYNNEFDVLNGLLMTFGVRVDSGTVANNEYDETSPRIALVQRLNEKVNLKLMRGHALKAPGIAEANQNTEKALTLRNPDDTPNVEPEVIDVLELAITYSDGPFFSSLTYFDNTTKNAIVKRPLDCSLYADEPVPNNCDNNNRTGDQPDFFLNDLGKSDTDGFELDVQYHGDNYWAMFNMAISDTETDSGGGIPNAPERKVNLAGHMDFDTAIPFGATLVIKHVNKYYVDKHTSYAGQTIFDIKLDTQLNEYTTVGAQILNITDQKYFQPFDGGIDDIPQPGREMLLSLDIKF